MLGTDGRGCAVEACPQRSEPCVGLCRRPVSLCHPVSCPLVASRLLGGCGGAGMVLRSGEQEERLRELESLAFRLETASRNRAAP